MAANKPLDDGHVSAGVVGGEANSINRVDTANDDADFQKIPKMDKVDEFGAHAKTDPKEIALVKKLDAYIIVSDQAGYRGRCTRLDANECQPILWLMYLFNFLDRNAIINARLNGLEKDLGLVGTQYNTCVSILFVG